MTTYTGTSGNDFWTVINPSTFTLDGAGGTDTLSLGTSLRSTYTITKSSDGAVHVDSISGASGTLHATLLNMETLYFNSNKDKLDLTTYFGTTTPPPTVSITDNTAGTAIGNVIYSLAFSETITGLTSSDFTVSNGSVVSIAGSGATYNVEVAPAANAEGTLDFTLNASAVMDASGNTNAATAAAAQLIDTKAPTVGTFNPANQASGVFTNSNIILTFSESIQRGTGNVTLKASDGTTVGNYDAASSSNLSISGNTLTIDPTSDLGLLTNYTIQFSAGSIKDLAGNSYAGTNTYSFTTASGALFNAPTGNNTINGGAGIDTVVFSGTQSQYQISRNAGSIQINGPTGLDALNNIDRVQFADAKLALDLDGNAGTTAKILGAVFGSASVSNKQYVGIGLSYLDGGMSYQDLMQLALNAAGATTHAAEVSLLWKNLFGTSPTAAQAAPYVAMLDNGTYSTGALGVMAADLDQNKTNINLVGLHQTGLAYS